MQWLDSNIKWKNDIYGRSLLKHWLCINVLFQSVNGLFMLWHRQIHPLTLFLTFWFLIWLVLVQFELLLIGWSRSSRTLGLPELSPRSQDHFGFLLRKVLAWIWWVSKRASHIIVTWAELTWHRCWASNWQFTWNHCAKLSQKFFLSRVLAWILDMAEQAWVTCFLSRACDCCWVSHPCWFTWHRWWGARGLLPASRSVWAATACVCSPPGKSEWKKWVM